MHKHDYDVSIVLIESTVLICTFTYYYAWNVHDHDDPIVLIESLFSSVHMILGWKLFSHTNYDSKLEVDSHFNESMSYFDESYWMKGRALLHTCKYNSRLIMYNLGNNA